MRKLKIFICIFIILGVGIILNLTIPKELNNENVKNEIINSTTIEVTKDEHEEIKNTLAYEQKNSENIINEVKEEVITKQKQEEKKVEIPKEKPVEKEIKEVPNPVVDNTKTEVIINKPVENKETKKEEIQEEIKVPEPTKKEEPKQEVVTPPVQTVTEEYRYNEAMTQQIINIINSNPSEYMLLDGYNVTVDSSITSLTNQFTFTEERVKNKILYKAGTIRVYAQDYYMGGQYLFTECYIM